MSWESDRLSWENDSAWGGTGFIPFGRSRHASTREGWGNEGRMGGEAGMACKKSVRACAKLARRGCGGGAGGRLRGRGGGGRLGLICNLFLFFDTLSLYLFLCSVKLR